MLKYTRTIVLILSTLSWWVPSARSAEADEPIPYHQDRPPGPALSPEQAIAHMQVPEGFIVELVASEPDIVNPVAMTFDERGRIWITESLEYPRHDPGPGRDRVKILEDTDGDGRADRFTVFAEGLNIPSGIAVGHGGVWVANAPDILFLQDVDGDGRADRREVVVSGFGRTDTHELPNSLTWGPDGWLYGLNGVFNRSHIKHQGKTYDFTCAVWRIHPRTRAFELFAEGTSNPWGIAWDPAGSLFVSACVIDHLWHITETGYYHRQAGNYPPFVWKLGSIVDHAHQKAAYCGLHYFDSDAYPAEYRNRLYMGNIHGGCINVDVLARDGATYLAKAAPDFLTAHDAWFMPVAQKTGPDGCLYILDWYDRYHCYQDAGRDAAGVDRLKGRLYRVRYRAAPRAPAFDLAGESSDQLIARLASPNVYFRDAAQRLLDERAGPTTRPKLERLVLDEQAPTQARMHALWALVGAGPLDVVFHRRLLAHADPRFRAWGVRAAGNQRQVDSTLSEMVAALAGDSIADVRLQVAIASRKVEGLDTVALLVQVLAASGDDKLIGPIVWQNLHPLLEDQSERFLELVEQLGPEPGPGIVQILPRVVGRLLNRRSSETAQVAQWFRRLIDDGDADPAVTRECLLALAHEIASGGTPRARRMAALREALAQPLGQVLATPAMHPFADAATIVLAAWNDGAGRDRARHLLLSAAAEDRLRLAALDALLFAQDRAVLDAVEQLLSRSDDKSAMLRRETLSRLGRLADPRVAEVVLAAYPRLETESKPVAIELLTARAVWARPLLAAIARQEIASDVLNANQVRKLLKSDDQALAEQIRATWGTVRDQRNPEREQVIVRIRGLLEHTPGDPRAGGAVFKKLCAQCHKLHGEGQEVGPDITHNGRASWEQLLSNVLDPSLVIGAAYQAHTVATTDGRILTGLMVEEEPERIALKLQGGKIETLPREEVDQLEASRLSMMPEDLEKQLSPQELADLFAYLALDKPPSDPTARRLPGAPAPNAAAGKE